MPTTDTDRIYTGKTISIALNRGEFSSIDLEACALWYFQFYKPGQDDVIFYLGVADVDVTISPQYPTVESFLPELTRRIALALPNVPYDLWHSGNKGYHIYFYSARFWVKPPQFNKAEINTWISGAVAQLYGNLYDIIDSSIYVYNHGIRPFTIPNPRTKVLPTLIRYAFDDTPFWNWMMENIIDTRPNIIQLPVNPPSTTSLNSSSTAIDTYSVDHNDMFDIIRQFFSETVNERVNFVHVRDNQYTASSRYCPIARRSHKRAKNFISVHPYHAKLFCFSVFCQKKHYLFSKSFPPLTQFYNLAAGLYQKQQIRSMPSSHKVLDPTTKYISKQDIDWCLSGNGVGAVFAPMGCGKTQATISWLGDQPVNFKVLLIVVRQTQANNFAHEYPHMKNYLKVKSHSLYDKRRLVVCLNSLSRVVEGQPPFRVPEYDLLILDEIESIVEVLVSSALSQGKSKHCDIWDLLITLIKGSKRVLFMDGIPTKRTARYLDVINVISHLKVLEHHVRPDYRTYLIMYSGEEFLKEIRSKIDAGKNVVLISNSKEQLDYFFSAVNVESSLMINGDSNKDIKATSSDPNTHWQKRLLAYNTAVGAGASFDTSHYHYMFVVLTTSSCTPQVALQLINRIRKLESATVRLIVIFQDPVVVPSKQELALKKVENIVGFHNKQEHYFPRYGIFTSAAKENIRLAVCKEDIKVVRELISNQMVVLKHENEEFLATSVEEEHDKLKLIWSTHYRNKLFKLIRMNGGLVEETSKTPNTKVLKLSAIFMKDEARVHSINKDIQETNIIWQQHKHLDAAITKKINMHVRLNDQNKFFLWMSLRRAITRSSPELYEYEFDKINSRKHVLNSIILFSNGIIEHFEKLRDLLEFQINYTTGIFSGSFNYSSFIGKETSMNNLCIRIASHVKQKTNQNYKFSTGRSSLGHGLRACFSNLKLVFDIFGVNLLLIKSARKSRGDRFADHLVEFDVFSQRLRMAIINLDPTTGEPDAEALTKFIDGDEFKSK